MTRLDIQRLSAVMVRAHTLLCEHGWTMGRFGYGESAHCTIGAIQDVTRSDKLRGMAYAKITDYLGDALNAYDEVGYFSPHKIVMWNDKDERSWEEVDQMFREIIRQLDDLLLPKATSDVHNAQLVG